MNDELHDAAKRIVETHIIMNASLLVTDILRLDTEMGHISWEDVQNLYIDTDEDAQEEGYASLREMQDDGADQQEVLEWWFVTEWLFNALREKNEVVLHSDYGRLWGRGASGQAIYMDSIMEELAKELIERNTP